MVLTKSTSTFPSEQTCATTVLIYFSKYIFSLCEICEPDLVNFLILFERKMLKHWD